MTTHNRKFKHLNKEERYTIYEMNLNNKSQQVIADSIGRSKSTISNELRRNRDSSKYIPCAAHEKYQIRLHKSDVYKIDQNPKLLAYICDAMIKKKWSPVISSTK